MMLIVPASRLDWARRQSPVPSTPWAAYAFLWAPFLIDVTGNTLDLYDTVVWWDDANHFVNWFLLSAGAGLILARTSLTQPWALGWLTVGIGAILAIGWELGEWYTFIRHGTELDTAYEDTLFDEVLGTLGAGAGRGLDDGAKRRSESQARGLTLRPGRRSTGRPRLRVCPPTVTTVSLSAAAVVQDRQARWGRTAGCRSGWSACRRPRRPWSRRNRPRAAHRPRARSVLRRRGGAAAICCSASFPT